MPETPLPFTIVVSGGSLPTSFRAPLRTRSFPQHLRAQFAGAVHFISMAKERRMVGDTLERVDRIVDLDPDAVIIWHGAREAQYAPSFLMQRLTTDLTIRHPRNLTGIRRTVKQHLYAAVQAVKWWPPKALTPVLLGMKPFVSVTEFASTFEQLIVALRENTRAKIFVVLTYLPERGEWHFSQKHFAANMAFIQRLDNRDGRLFLVDGGSTLRLNAENFAEDNYHLSAKGHVMMAALLEEQIRTHMRTVDSHSARDSTR